MRRLTSLSLTLTLMLCATAARSQSWIGTGTPVVSTPGAQVALTTCTDGADGVYHAWVDFRGPDADVYLQHLDASGAVVAGWPSTGLPVCTAIQQQLGPILTPDGVGGVYVAWGDYRTGSSDIYLSRIGSNGTRASGWSADGDAVSSQVAIRSSPAIALDPAGGVYVAFQRVTSSLDVFLARLTSSGARASGWPVSGIALTSSAADEDTPVIATDPAGSCLVVWVNEDINEGDLRAARVRPNATLASGWTAADGREILPTLGLQTNARIVPRTDGGFLVYFLDNHAGTGNFEVRAVGFDSTGVALAGWNDPLGAGILTRAATDAIDFTVTSDGADGAVAVSSEYDAVNDITALFAVRHDAAHAFVWPDTIQVTDFGVTNPPALERDSQGGFLIAYADTFPGHDATDLHMTRLLASTGAVAAGWAAGTGNPVCTQPGSQTSPVLVGSGSGSGIVGWVDTRGADPDVYAARVGSDGVVPTQLALSSAWARADAVELVWSGGSGAPELASVERREGEGAWTSQAELWPDGDGRFTFVDHSVRPGVAYAYRLRTATRLTAEAWVQVPTTATLALSSRNPNEGALRFVAHLGSDADAEFVLLDLAGRVRHTQRLHGVGAHTLSITDAPLEPGVYLARLRQSGRQVQTKVSIVR